VCLLSAVCGACACCVLCLRVCVIAHLSVCVCACVRVQESAECEVLEARFDHRFHFQPPYGSIRTANLESVRRSPKP
jgi:hypothetical protein